MSKLFYISYEFPVLTQTFTVGEVRGLASLGIDLEVVSCLPGPEVPGVAVRHLGALGPARRAGLLLAWFVRRPLELLSLLGRIATARYRHQQVRCWARGFRQLAWGTEVAEAVRREAAPVHLHAQFVDAASTVAWVAGRLTGAPFSITNHTAYNPYLPGPKLARAKVMISISEFDRRLLRRQAGTARGRIEVVYQGIDLERFPFRPPARTDGPLRVLSVAALREKKGHHVLIEAVGRLRGEGLDVRLVIVGEGPERGRLEAAIERRGIGDAVTLAGAEPPERVRERLPRADVFALACVVASNGDLDGIPISLMEAMATGVPVATTRLSGIPELVEDGREGLLAEPGDAAGMADCLRRLATEPDLPGRLAAAAREKVRRQHDRARSVAALAAAILGE